jgi:hypothetical protein
VLKEAVRACYADAYARSGAAGDAALAGAFRACDCRGFGAGDEAPPEVVERWQLRTATVQTIGSAPTVQLLKLNGWDPSKPTNVPPARD